MLEAVLVATLHFASMETEVIKVQLMSSQKECITHMDNYGADIVSELVSQWGTYSYYYKDGRLLKAIELQCKPIKEVK